MKKIRIYFICKDLLTGVNNLENTFIENNKVQIAGTVASEMTFSHMIYGEKFYLFKLNVPRLSENNDLINITISERFFPLLKPEVNDILLISGQFRSYNNYSDTGNRLILTVFVKTIEYLSSTNEITNPNRIFLNGYVCKPPVYRTTPFQREIADILLAVNRAYNKSDYIPCIAWGRNAKYAETISVGTNLHIWGRIQSRDYQKRINDDEYETKTAYEISITKLEKIEQKIE